MAKIKVMSVFGTRPEAIKMCPLVKRLEAHPQIDSVVCVTGQHREMLAQVLEAFGVVPDHDLDIMTRSQTLSEISARVLTGLDGVIAAEEPDLVLVHGDTSSSFLAALTAFYRKVPVGHVEAGLRTHDIHAPFPEELNRQLTDRICELLFCPTEANVANLAAEACPGATFVTGNTVIDALATTVRDDYSYACEALSALGETDEREGGSREVLLVTAHRRENWDGGIASIARAVRRLVEGRDDRVAVWPVHLNPIVRDVVEAELSDVDNVILTEPLEVLDLHNLMARATLILTDSGGIQEEAPSLGRPVLILREETERPEIVDAGCALLVGADEDKIVAAATCLLEDAELYEQMAAGTNPYGDGYASYYIMQAISERFGLEAPQKEIA